MTKRDSLFLGIDYSLGLTDDKLQGTQRQMELHRDPKGPKSLQTTLKVLRTYAQLSDASATALPPTLYFSHTRHTLTIFDVYPKALFRFLVLPRLSAGDGDDAAADLRNLRTLVLLRASADAQARARAHETLRVLADEAARLRGAIAEEMRARYGFAWDVWAGFHAVPSLE